MNKTEKKLNFDYSLLHLFYWALSAIIFCFTTVYLQSKDYSNYEIGIVFALGNIVGFVLQPTVAGYIDRSQKRTLIKCIRITAMLSVLLMLAVYLLPENCLPLTGAYVLLLAGNTLLSPLCTSLSFYIESWGHKIVFSRARAVGSLAYSLCSMALGVLVQRVSAGAVPISYIVFSIAMGLLTISFSRSEKLLGSTARTDEHRSGEKPSGLLEFARENKRFMIFLFGTAVMYFTHAMIGNFMIEFIRSIGGDSTDLGNVLAFMTIMEVPVMLLFARLTEKFRCSTLLRFSVIMFTVKELMIYLAPSVGFLYAAVAFQGLSFALFIPASVRYVDEVIVKRNAVKGQAFVTSMLALGSIFASYIGGLLLDATTPKFTLLVGVIISAVGTFILLASIQTTDK